MDSERALISAALVDAKRTVTQAAGLQPEAFGDGRAATIWRTINAMVADGSAVDAVTLQSRLPAAEREDASMYLTTMLTADIFGSPALADQYQRAIEEAWLRRRLIEFGYALAEQAYDPKTDPEEVHSGALRSLADITIGKTATKHLGAFVDEAMTVIDRLMTDNRSLTGIDTGYHLLNRITHGFQAPDLWLLAARPSVGKTTLCINMACHAAASGAPVAVFELEQSGRQLAMRMIAAAASVNMRALRGLSTDRQQDIVAAMNRLKKLPVWVDPSCGHSMGQIRAEARRLKAKHNIKLVIVDYIQIIRQTNAKQNRLEHITDVSGQLKQLAKELDVCVVALSQMSRGMAKEKRRPRLDDLRDSGALEQDADIVLLLSGNVEEDELPTKLQGVFSPHELEKLVLVDVAKNRDGDTGPVFLRFDKEYTRYCDITLTPQPAKPPEEHR